MSPASKASDEYRLEHAIEVVRAPVVSSHTNSTRSCDWPYVEFLPHHAPPCPCLMDASTHNLPLRMDHWIQTTSKNFAMTPGVFRDLYVTYAILIEESPRALQFHVPTKTIQQEVALQSSEEGENGDPHIGFGAESLHQWHRSLFGQWRQH